MEDMVIWIVCVILVYEVYLFFFVEVRFILFYVVSLRDFGVD